MLKSGAGVAAAGIVGLAGCADLRGGVDDGDGGDEGATDDPSETANYELAGTSLEAVGEWLLPPETLDVDPYGVEVVTPARLEPARDHLERGFAEQLDYSAYLVSGGEWGDVAVLGFATYGYGEGEVLLARGSLDVDRIRGIAESDGMDPADDYGGYEVYVDDRGAVCFDETTYLMTFRDAPREAIEGAVDAATGRGRRYADEHDWFARLVDAVPDGDLVVVDERASALERHDVEGASARAETYDVGGEETVATETVLFEDEADATTTAGQAYRDSRSDRPEDATVAVDGRTLRLEWEMETYRIPGITGG